MDEKIVKLVRKILDEEIDHAEGKAYLAYCKAYDIFEYAVAGNYEVLQTYYGISGEEDES